MFQPLHKRAWDGFANRVACSASKRGERPRFMQAIRDGPTGDRANKTLWRAGGRKKAVSGHKGGRLVWSDEDLETDSSPTCAASLASNG
jgi:hypothetical protein